MLVEGENTSNLLNLSISNSQIYNSLNTNLKATTAKINATNLVIGSAGVTAASLELGGAYNFNHCTIANYWRNGFRNSPSLLISNFQQTTEGQIIASDLLNTRFTNTVIDGNRALELALLKNDSALFQYNFTNCTIKFTDTSNDFVANPLYNFENTQIFESILLNGELQFKNTQVNNFSILANSIAIDKGNSEAAELSPTDILGNLRTVIPDIGAYEFIFEN